jgi:translation initiation factor 2-alpha kinase 3
MALAVVSSQHRQAGTKFYCPPILNNDNTICPKLDVYSLGVIAFELCTKFGTKTERAVVLEKLNCGTFPREFDEHELAEGIKGMLCGRREDRWTCAQVRKWLRNINEKF